MNELDPELIRRYEEANYHVSETDRRITFRVNEKNPDLDKLLDDHNSQIAVFITAHNPKSQVLSPAENDLAQNKLLEELKDRGLYWLAGESGDAGGNWTPESSVLVFGMDRDTATTLARQFRQHAYICIERGQPPLLVLTQ